VIVFLLFAKFFDSKKEGWHFYCDPCNSNPAEYPPKTIPELKKQLQAALDQAIWQPTPGHVLRYMKLQKMLMDKSEQFAAAWEQVIIMHPEFDPTIKNPTSYYGSLHAREVQEKKSAGQLKKHMKDYALFLVVGRDEMSAALTAVVQDMAKYRGYQIMIVNGQDQSDHLSQFGIKRLPALLMIHVPSGKRFILTYGLIGADKIEERMVQVISASPPLAQQRG
jgi:hypothetical protein